SSPLDRTITKNKPPTSFSFSRYAPHLLVRCGGICASFVRSLHLRHRFKREAFPIGGFGVQRRHCRAAPTEDRVQLRDGCAVLCCARRADLAAAVRRLVRDTSGYARFLEGVAK